MKSVDSEEIKSSSGTSESERQNFKLKLLAYQYPPMPQRDINLRQQQNQKKIKIITNLFEIKLIDEYHKFALYSVDIMPGIAADNFSLRRQIYNNLDMPKCFKKFFWAGNNFYSLINEDKEQDYSNIEKDEEVNGVIYNIKLKKIKEISFKNINHFDGTNQQIKSIIENIFRSILMKNPKVIKFHDRTIFEIDPKNIINVTNQDNDKIYKGYITSAHITENGLFMQINNRSKLITGKTALQKMTEIKSKLLKQNASNKEINDAINEYFNSHRTVLTTYGSIRTYRIKEVNLNRNPENTDITIKVNNGVKRTISIINYYKVQYGIEINQKNQPLLVAENKNSKNKKFSSDKKNNLSTENDYEIYLIPELVYITGLEEDYSQNNRRKNHRNLIEKTKMNPAKKMEAINGINNLINSDNRKKIKKKNGQEIILKSSKQLIEEWGINIGNNLTFTGRVIPQPQIYFSNNKIFPKNGLFRADKPIVSQTITNENIFFVYDKNEKNSNHRSLFTEIMKKCQNKNFKFSENFHPNKVNGYSLDNTHNWESILNSLRRININDKNSIGIIFCSQQLEKFYEKLKNFFSQQFNIPTQHINTKNIENQRIKNSIEFNLVDQINIKRGGMNYYIDFKNEGIIKSGEVFLIIGLDSKTSNKQITYSMTSTNNSRLNNFITQEETCRLINQEKNKTLKKMFEVAIDEINKNCPHSPDYIIIYRQGGNEIRNKILCVNELDSFNDILKEYREKYKDNNNFHFRNTKLYYICCNLKSDLKFFETEDHGISKAYFNPQSGLIVDDNVTQRNKFEFYLQPQFVNQGTATPCHYQIMHYDKDQKEENEFKIENLEKLSFYLSFYYWTWTGSIRIPSLLKMSTTALSFYSRIFHNQTSCLFRRPIYI